MVPVLLELRGQNFLGGHWLPSVVAIRQHYDEATLAGVTEREGAPMLIAVAGATGRLGTHLVEVLAERDHDVVPISRSQGVDVTTGAGLDDALKGVDCIIDASTGPSPDYAEAAGFFTAATGNLHRAGQAAGVRRMLLVSIVGIDRWPEGYGKAKLEQEQAALAGPIPTRILRATQFHEFVGQLLDWGTQGEIGYVADLRTQLVSARSVAEALANLAAAPAWAPGAPTTLEIAGPRPENLIDAATLLAAKRGHPAKVEITTSPDDPYDAAETRDAMLPGPGAILAGPTFGNWLETAEV
jgi:uncharacterized protein YbjT (DUF2867 family)